MRTLRALTVVLVATASIGCGSDDDEAGGTATAATATVAVDESALRAEAAQVRQTMNERLEAIRAAKTPDELEAAIDDLQQAADEHALALDRLEASAERTPQKQALSSMLRDLSGRLSDVQAAASQSPSVEAALEGEAFEGLAQLESEINALARELE